MSTRMPNTMVQLLAAAVIVTGVPGGARAQRQAADLDAYDRALKAYVDGRDLTAAVAPLQHYSGSDFNTAAKRIIDGKDSKMIETAAIFHLEVGIGMLGLAPATAEGHFRIGSRLLSVLQPPKKEQWGSLMAQHEELLATWYGVAGSAFLSVNDPLRARLWIQRALGIKPDSPVFRTMDGAMHELSAQAANPDFFPPGSRQNRALAERRRLLAMAEDAYEEALRADAAYVLATIRLGRVQFLRNDFALARMTLTTAEQRARDVPQRYLAALFLGGAHERLNDTAAARSAYERALDAVPHSQAAIVALSHLESASGRIDRAQALARGFAKFTSVDDRYWWAYKNGGLDEQGLAWLRARVRR